MTRPKETLKNVTRIADPDETRLDKLRLDMNENVIGLDKKIMKRVFADITRTFLVTYPVIIDKKEPICSVKDGLQSVAILEASRIACETGKTIFLDQLYR